MQLRNVSGILALLTVAALAFAPSVAASPISATLNWSLQSVPQGSSTTATATVGIDSDCPVGQTFSGTITVTEPDGVSVATYSVAPTACGTNVVVSYPSGFAGVAGTSELGSYAASWAGSSSVLVGGGHPSFVITNNFVVVSFPPPPQVPQFGAPAMLVAAMGLVLIAAMKGRKALKF